MLVRSEQRKASTHDAGRLFKAKEDSELGFPCRRQDRGGKGKRRPLGNSVPGTAQLIDELTAIQGRWTLTR